MNRFHATLMSLVLAATASAIAQPKSDDHSTHHGGTSAGSTAADLVEGEVRKVDAEAAKLTLKHAEIKSLDMPAMTMVFNVRDKALLANVKAGDKVRFRAVNEDGKFTVTELQVAR